MVLVHWGTRFTRELVYKEQAELLDILTGAENVQQEIAHCRRKYAGKKAQEKASRLIKRVKNKVKRTLGIKQK